MGKILFLLHLRGRFLRIVCELVFGLYHSKRESSIHTVNIECIMSRIKIRICREQIGSLKRLVSSNHVSFFLFHLFYELRSISLYFSNKLVRISSKFNELLQELYDWLYNYS
jgi:hypothetical protein